MYVNIFKILLAL